MLDQKRVTEILTADELLEIQDRVVDSVRAIWEGEYSPTAITYCDACPGPLSHKLKQRCICSVMTREALCPSCYAQRLEQELINECINRKKPSLDVDDFARI
jgi:hypothetical protein